MITTANPIHLPCSRAGFRLGHRGACVLARAIVAVSMVSAEIMTFGPVSYARTIQMASSMSETTQRAIPAGGADGSPTRQIAAPEIEGDLMTCSMRINCVVFGGHTLWRLARGCHRHDSVL